MKAGIYIAILNQLWTQMGSTFRGGAHFGELEPISEDGRQHKYTFHLGLLYKDLVIVGAGMPGLVAAIQAARLGLSVALGGKNDEV